ncbi:hypothetical protein [Sulfurospirillum barnesii]|uniref:Uncharacterized protein n=1 Tax=Sulfurospirillum barnesii (strain ATCC 700032 / DSM 10660 / SES-3) TaxID=760154 RepID=I3XXS3_SULBS|nr:hypothetical protein [Sulfurospirillum barnesii]AFL68747.1 hypothetical protein Sulba_1459 [Sulfurospirillum barnesii SES-3]
MQKIVLILLMGLGTLLFACGGSCLECHPKLEPYSEDKDHRILKECTSCHNTPSKNGMCGQDCFECHSRDKLYAQKDIEAHQALKACKACHKEKEDFLRMSPASSPTQETLIDLFKK